jgi:hypothetical protein
MINLFYFVSKLQQNSLELRRGKRDESGSRLGMCVLTNQSKGGKALP